MINLETGEFIEVEVVEENLPADINIEPVVNYNPIEIDFNYETLKEVMTNGLEAYKIEVTYDNIKEANKMATKLNKLGSSIKRARIDNKKEMLAPITDFEVKMNDLEDTAKKGRLFILDQVKVFNDELVKICELECNKLLVLKYEEKEVNEEFQTLNISDIFIASNINPSMKLTKKAKDTIESRVNIQLSLQTNKKMRLVMLENECLKAGLKVLLKESDVSHFILESDLKYNEQLTNIINRELEKQAQIEKGIEQERIRKEEFEKQQKEIEVRRIEQEELEELEKQAQIEIKEVEKVQAIEKETGVRIVKYIATFEMEVPLTTTNEAIKNKYDSKMQEFSKTFQESEIR